MLQNTALYVAAGLLPNVVNLVLLPVYTRFLEPADFGLVSLVSTLVSVLATFSGLQIANSISRLYFDYTDEKLNIYVSTVLFGLLAINTALVLGYHMVGSALTRVLFPRTAITYAPYVLLGLINLFFTAIINFCNGLFRVQERADIFFGGSLSFVVVGAGLGLFFVVLRRMGAEGVLLAAALNAALHAGVLTLCIRSRLRWRFNAQLFRAALRFSLPLIPHALGMCLFMYTDKYILSFYVPLSVIGIYDLACRLANVLRMIITSYFAAVVPDFMKTSRLDTAAAAVRYAGIITRWTVVLAALFLGLSLFAREILMVLAPPAYQAARSLVPILAAGFVFRGLEGFPVAALMFMKKTRSIPVITFGAGLLNVGLNLWLIPHFGIVAAAWTTLAAYIMAFGLALWFARRNYPLRMEWKAIAGILGLALTLLGAGIAVGGTSVLPGMAIKMSLFGVFVGVVWWVNPGDIVNEVRTLLDSCLLRRWRAKGKTC